ncbi:hypothetical protein [Methanolobus sp. ZRKC5]
MIIKYQVNELEMKIMGFQRKDPGLLTTSVLTMIKSDDTTISTDIMT